MINIFIQYKNKRLIKKLKSFRKEYENKPHLYSDKKVMISLKPNFDNSPVTFDYSIFCACNDELHKGIGITDFIKIYGKNGFKNLIDAEIEIYRNVLFASREFKSTIFYLDKPLDSSYSSLGLNKRVYLKHIRNDYWKKVDSIDFYPICNSCGYEITDDSEIRCKQCNNIRI